MTLRNLLLATTFAATTLLASTAIAAPCDNAIDAWRAVHDGVDALNNGRTAQATQLVAPLMAATCTPTGEQADLIGDAQREARVLTLEARTREFQLAMQRFPRAPARATPPAFATYQRTQMLPFLQRSRATLDALAATARPLMAATEQPSLAVDAIVALADLYVRFALMLRNTPVPPALRGQQALMDLYQTQIDTVSAPYLSIARSGFERVRSLASQEHLTPRPARIAMAWLRLNGIAIDPVRGAPPVVLRSGPTVTEGSVGESNLDATPVAQTAHELVRTTMRRNMSTLERCYRDGLARDPNVQGNMLVRMVVGPNGNVTRVEVVETVAALEPIRSCVIDELGRLRFPLGVSGQTVQYPIAFAR